jgi:deoxyribodipyrimidine photo-lyase
LSTTADPIGIHWFRRDLRVAGNNALRKNWERHKGRLLGLFCFDSRFLSRDDFSHNRFAFFMNALESLQKELRDLGGDLLVVDSSPQKAFPEIVEHLRNARVSIDLVSWSRDYEPFARARDEEMKKIFFSINIKILEERDHLLLEPEEVFKARPGEFYQVYSPFAKKYFDLMKTSEVQKRIKSQQAGFNYLEHSLLGKRPPIFSLNWNSVGGKNFPFKDELKRFQEINHKKVTIPIPAAGSLEAYKTLKEFSGRLKEYKIDRDIPSVHGTSHLSLFLKNGTITSSQIIHYLDLGKSIYANENSSTRFLKEIIWREFYYAILFHRPDVEKHSFLEKFREIPWPNNKDLFAHWCEGTTGFPLVDAGMRQLNTTGWMHNRVRMVVASFLCKDLLIDWRWGENYFMKMLLDGDLAPNNGGWQWAASTGCDPQPYFRIFNPWLQSAKFDPQGVYIKTYVPELKDIPAKQLHDPEGHRGNYPLPIVDHAVQKKLALKLYTDQRQ